MKVAVDPRLALIVGLIVGLLISALSVALATAAPGVDGPRTRPDGLPEAAVWLEDAFGQPGWIACTAAAHGVQCQAFTRSGVATVVVSYVPDRARAAPKPPFEHVVAREVDKIWLNKVAMVPDGPVEFPVTGQRIDYDDGRRLGDPTP